MSHWHLQSLIEAILEQVTSDRDTILKTWGDGILLVIYGSHLCTFKYTIHPQNIEILNCCKQGTHSSSKYKKGTCRNSCLIKRCTSYFSKFTFLFHLRIHSFMMEIWKFHLKLSNLLILWSNLVWYSYLYLTVY